MFCSLILQMLAVNDELSREVDQDDVPVQKTLELPLEFYLLFGQLLSLRTRFTISQVWRNISRS